VSGQEVALIPATATDRWRYAESLAGANMLPAAFRNRPADVFYAVEYGAMLGLSPIAALTGIHVIEGKPSASSALMSALVRRAGHRLRVRVEGAVEDATVTATAELVRADDPEHTFVARWTLQRAAQAGLLDLKRDGDRVIPWSRSTQGKPQAWEKYPEAMLKARAISEVARDGAEECLFGAHYTPEELGAAVDQDGDIIPGEVIDTPTPAAQGVRVQQVPQQVAPPAAEAAVVEEPVPPAAARVDEAQKFAALVARRAAAEADVDVLRATYQGVKEARRHVLDINILDVIEPAWVAAIGLQPDGAMPLGAWLMAVGRWVKANGRAVTAPSPVVEDGDGPEDPWAVPATDADLPPEARAAVAALDARTVDDLDRIKTHAGPALLAVDITWAVSDATAAALRLEGSIGLGDLIAAARRHLTAGDGTTVREAVALAAQN
jgi:hypothetical protein